MTVGLYDSTGLSELHLRASAAIILLVITDELLEWYCAVHGNCTTLNKTNKPPCFYHSLTLRPQLESTHRAIQSRVNAS